MESGGQAEQAVGGAEQALAEQHRQCREDAAVGDGVGWLGEHRRGLGQQAGAASTRPLTSRAARPMGACLSRASRVARSVGGAWCVCGASTLGA